MRLYFACVWKCVSVPLMMNGPLFAKDISKNILSMNMVGFFSIKKCHWILFVRVQIVISQIRVIAWQRAGDKSLSKPKLLIVLKHTYVPQFQGDMSIDVLWFVFMSGVPLSVDVCEFVYTVPYTINISAVMYLIYQWWLEAVDQDFKVISEIMEWSRNAQFF